MKAATGLFVEMKRRNGFQSTPPVKAATQETLRLLYILIISIHAAREGGDVSLLYVLIIHREFQSTPPVKAATSRLFRC